MARENMDSGAVLQKALLEYCESLERIRDFFHVKVGESEGYPRILFDSLESRNANIDGVNTHIFRMSIWSSVENGEEAGEIASLLRAKLTDPLANIAMEGHVLAELRYESGNTRYDAAIRCWHVLVEFRVVTLDEKYKEME